MVQTEGLELIRRLAADARAHMNVNAGGYLMFEHGHDQGAASTDLLRYLGYSEVSDYNDLSGKPRVSMGHWPGSRQA